MAPAQELHHKEFGDCHTEEYFCEDRTTEMNIGKQRNTKSTRSFRRGFALCAHWRATGSVAADDMVPMAVR